MTARAPDVRNIGLDEVPAMIWFKDAENRILRANRAAAESVGLPVDAIEGRSTYDLYPEEAAAYYADDLEVIRSGSPKTGIIEQLTTAAGEKRWVRTDKIPYRAADGTVVGVVVFAVDITAQKSAEGAKAEEAEVFAGLARVGEACISPLDTPVLLERLCQVTTEVLECDSVSTLLRRPEDDVYVPVASHGGTPEEREFRRGLQVSGRMLGDVVTRLRDEEVMTVDPATARDTVEKAAYPVPPLGGYLCMALRSGGQVVGLHVARQHDPSRPFTARQRRLARGISEIASLALAKARLVEEIERAAHLKSVFVSTLSHELRTPLNVILGYAQMGDDPALDDAHRRRLMKQIERAGRQLLELIESTLDIGRIESGGAEDVRAEPVALPSFWQTLREGCATIPHAPGVSVEWGDEAPAVTLTTDPRKLTVVLRNLVGNALKFTERGWVRVEARADEERVSFAVQDTGIGVRPEDQVAIFEMFRQGDGSDSRRFGGSGLGLYIVRRFMQQLGGTVTLESTLRRGSTFTVTLPRMHRLCS